MTSTRNNRRGAYWKLDPVKFSVYITDAAKKIANKKTKKQMEEAVNLLLEIKCNDGSFSYKSYSDSTISVVNPFDYSEKRIR